MEIHAPDHPVHSIKTFAIHLAIVTIGILIALSLENTVEWLHHRSLASEARLNIQAEIRENQRRLESYFEIARSSSTERKALMKAIDDVRAKKIAAFPKVDVHYTIKELSSAAWQTAATTGALGHMPYGEVRGYAELYAMQSRFEDLQGQFLREFGLTDAPGREPATMTEAELQGWKEHLIIAESLMATQRGIAKILQKAYPMFTMGGR
jgi:hypothetical protein